jgi:hypothetical protein
MKMRNADDFNIVMFLRMRKGGNNTSLQDEERNGWN